MLTALYTLNFILAGIMVIYTIEPWKFACKKDYFKKYLDFFVWFALLGDLLTILGTSMAIPNILKQTLFFS